MQEQIIENNSSVTITNNYRITNITERIKRLLFNYDLTIATIQAEINIRDSNIELIDSVVAASNKKDYTKKQLKEITLLKADKTVFENCLEKTLCRRNKLLENISTIFERFNNHDVLEKIFIEKYLKEITPEEENNLKTKYPEYDEIIKIIDSLLITFYK